MNRARLRAVAAFAFAFCAASLFAIDYTWTGEGDDALWTNPANWGQTTKYPGSGDRATFPENCTAEVEIGSVNNYQAVSMLKVCAGASVRIYAHDPTAETRLDLKSAWELNYAGNAVEFDHVRVDGGKDLTLGSASTLTLENGSDLRVGAFNVKAAASVSVLSGSVVSSGNIDADSSVSTSITVDNSTWTTGTNNDFTFKNTATLSLLNGASLSINQFIANGAGTLLTIDDSTFIVRHCVQLGTSAPGGGHVVFKGANAVMRCTDEAYNNASFKPWSNSATMTSHFDFDFEVPEGGFADVPLQWSGQKAAFAEVGNVPADYIRFNVLSTSPALCAGTKTDCVLFYSSVKGITRSKVTNGDAETATLSFSDESGEAEAASDAEAVALWATVGSGAAANATPGVGSLTPRRTTAVNRNVITVDGAVSAVASGDCTTQVELWCGTANDAAAMERYAVVVPARGPARFSVVYSAPENVGEVTHYFQWRLFDIGAGDVTNKTAVSAVFSAATKDATTYTWKDADGDWSGDWNDPAHWTSDYASATGYPASGNATAVFPRNHAITVTITDNFTVGTVDLSDYDAVEGETIDVTFKGAEGEGGGTNKALTVSTLFNISGPLGTVTLDNAAVKANAGDLKPGPNGTFRLVNGAYFYAAGGWETASVGNWPTTLELHGKSVMSIGDVFTRNDKKIIIDDSRLVFRSQVQLSRLGVGGDIVFMGANPVAYFDSTTSNCFMPSSAPENNFIFYVPAGGFDAPPIQCKSTNTRGLFVNTKTSGYIAFIVPDDSPCYSTVGTFDAPLIAWTSTVEITTNRFDYGALPDGGYFMLGTSAAEDYGFVEQSSFSGTAKSLGVHIVSAAHPNRVVVSADSDAAAAAVTGFDPALGTFDTYSSGDVVTFAAPAATTAGGVRYKVAGYTLNTYADGLMTAVESTEEGAGNSVQVTLPGKPVEVVWHFAADYPVTATAVNDAGAAVALSGDGHTASSSPVTLTASTATEGMEFQYWYGDVPYANRYDNPLVVAADKAASVYAFFGATPDNGGVRYATANISGGNYKNFFDTATWTGGIIPGTNDTAVLVATRGDTYSASNKSKFYVPSFFAVHDLIVSNACLYVAVTPTEWNNPNFQFDQNGYPFYNIGSSADAYRTEPVGFDVAGDVILRPYYTTQQNQNGSIFVGGSQQRCFTKVNIGGDLVLEDGAFQISAGHPFDYTLDPAKAIDGPNGFIAFPHEEELFRGGNRLKVGGEVTLAASAGLATNFIHVANDFRTGAAVWLDLKDVTVGEGAAITAWRGGYGKFDGKGVADGRSYSMCPGGHSTGDNTSGGSYGGLGGSETQNPGYQKPTAHVAVYGYEYFPINPGSPNGGNAGIESRGGGSIRLDCATLNLDGGLVANGHNAGGNKGGSSGGGILVVCGAFNPGANCLVSAEGGAPTGSNSGAGGGRIAICEGLAAEQVAALQETKAVPEGVMATALADKLGSRVSAAARIAATDRSLGWDGTAWYLVNTAGKKTLTVAGDPENIGAPVPSYGPQVFDDGEVVAVSAPEATFVSADNRSRRLAVGYTLADTATGSVVADASATSDTITMDGDYTLTWKLTELQHRVDISCATTGGAITTNAIGAADAAWQTDGSAVSVTAVPAAGWRFAGWTGEIAEANQHDATASFTIDAPLTLRAVFVSDAAETATWTGSGDGSDWCDAANWSSGKVPGPRTAVRIGGEAVVSTSAGLVFEVASLTVESGASLSFLPEGVLTTRIINPHVDVEGVASYDLHDCGVVASGDILVGGTLVAGLRHSLADAKVVAGGSFTVAEGASVTVNGGYNDALIGSTAPAAWRSYGAVASAGGAMTVDGTLALYGDAMSGSPVKVSAASLAVGATGVLHSNAGGWSWIYLGINYDYSLGGMAGGSYNGGAYGGFGGGYNGNPSLVKDYANKQTYGDALRPFLPGSPGGNSSGTFGGGALRIDVAGRIVNDGTISANGSTVGASTGGGSGGSVWISCRTFENGAAGALTANGGNNTSNGGAGGGGRILVCEKLSSAQIDALYQTGEAPRKVAAVEVTAENAASLFGGTVTAAGGTNVNYSASNPYWSGTAGSVWRLEGQSAPLIILVR